MQDIINVAFRSFRGYWEAYGIDVPVYGFGESLAEVKADVQEALAAYFDQDGPFEINEFQERRVHSADEACPDIWVRTFMDRDPDQMLKRREFADLIQKQLEMNPEYLATFRNGISSLGDIIATVCFEDDMLADLIDQIGDADLLYVCMPAKDGLYWNCVFTSDSEDHPSNSKPVSGLGLGDAATVGQFMYATNSINAAPKSYLVAA